MRAEGRKLRLITLTRPAYEKRKNGKQRALPMPLRKDGSSAAIAELGTGELLRVASEICKAVLFMLRISDPEDAAHIESRYDAAA